MTHVISHPQSICYLTGMFNNVFVKLFYIQYDTKSHGAKSIISYIDITTTLQCILKNETRKWKLHTK